MNLKVIWHKTGKFPVTQYVLMNPLACIAEKYVTQPKQFTQEMMKVMKGLNFGVGAMIARQTHFIK